jgi:hypothetical protein
VWLQDNWQTGLKRTCRDDGFEPCSGYGCVVLCCLNGRRPDHPCEDPIRPLPQFRAYESEQGRRPNSREENTQNKGFLRREHCKINQFLMFLRKESKHSVAIKFPE